MADFKYAKLRGRIIEKYGSQEKFARVVGISNTSMSKKMNGLSGFSQKDIIKWSALLEIDLHDVGDYYYA